MEKSWLKRIRSLQQKKFRKLEGLFLVEGGKSVLELVGSHFEIAVLFCTANFAETHRELLESKEQAYTLVKEQDLVRAGTFKSNEHALAVVETPAEEPFPTRLPPFTLLLESINDPGNLGAIIRIADWYGIRHIVCSPDTVDFYSPKVIQATMGSFTRVHLHYQDLSLFLREQKGAGVYAATMQGENLHEVVFEKPAMLVMGSESHGVSPTLLGQMATRQLTIPRYGGAESLNVAMATAICCDHFRRQHPKG